MQAVSPSHIVIAAMPGPTDARWPRRRAGANEPARRMSRLRLSFRPYSSVACWHWRGIRKPLCSNPASIRPANTPGVVVAAFMKSTPLKKALLLIAKLQGSSTCHTSIGVHGRTRFVACVQPFRCSAAPLTCHQGPNHRRACYQTLSDIRWNGDDRRDGER